jgi:hypothetical protein
LGSGSEAAQVGEDCELALRVLILAVELSLPEEFQFEGDTPKVRGGEPQQVLLDRREAVVEGGALFVAVD